MQVMKTITPMTGSAVYRTLDGTLVARECRVCRKIQPGREYYSKAKGRSSETQCRSCNYKDFSERIDLTYVSPENHNKNTKRYRDKLARRTATQVRDARNAKHPLGKKRCSKCKKDKDFSKFHNNRGTLDGLSCQCKQCTRK